MSKRTVAPQIADELYTLARNGASGAMEINGNPSGTIYLGNGYLTFAESSGVPDLRTRLIRSRRLSDKQWNLILKGGQPHGIGTLLVERGFITRKDLQAVLRSAALDAVTALMVPVAGESYVAGTRFTPQELHWAGSMLRLDIESVRTEINRIARRLIRHPLPLEARPRLAELRRPWTTVKRDQWTVACKIDGVATIRDLAWRHGFALHDTIEQVGELVGAGLCTLITPEIPAPPPDDDRPVASEPPAAAIAPTPEQVPEHTAQEADAAPKMADPPLPDAPKATSAGRPPADSSQAQAQAQVQAAPAASQVQGQAGPAASEPANEPSGLLPRRKPGAMKSIPPPVTGASTSGLLQTLNREATRAPLDAGLLQEILEGLKRL